MKKIKKFFIKHDFWSLWVLQALGLYVVVAFYVTPLWFDFLGAFEFQINSGQAWLFTFAVLSWIWVLQLFALSFYEKDESRIKWLVVFGTYVYGLGAAVAIAHKLLLQVKMQHKTYWELLVLLTIGFWIIIYNVEHVYTSLIGGAMLKFCL
ncbi:MAG: hypothetical protein ABIH21_00940 [Patescibacteria group bacterium]